MSSTKPSGLPLENDPENARARRDEETQRNALRERDAAAVGEVMDALVTTRNAVEKPTSAPLSLAQFEELLTKEGLADKLPKLRKQLDKLAKQNQELYGFGFDPDQLTIPQEDLPRMLLGLKEGILVRPLVVDSPTKEDRKRLKLNGAMTMIEYRTRRLAASGGMQFFDQDHRLATWSKLREVHWTDLGDDDGDVDASMEHLAKVYPSLPPIPTIQERTGAAPHLVLIGPDDEPKENRVLADGADGQLRIETRTDTDRSVQGTLESRAHLLSPEAALLALGMSRYGQTSRFARQTWAWTSGVTPSGDVAGVGAGVGDVDLDWNHPANGRGDDRGPASSE